MSKTEVLYQPAAGVPSQPVKIVIDGAEVKQTNKFCYLVSVLRTNQPTNLGDNAVGDCEIQCRIQKPAASFGLLHQRLWKRQRIITAVKVHRCCAVTILLYGGESCMDFLSKTRQTIEASHARCLRKILSTCSLAR